MQVSVLQFQPRLLDKAHNLNRLSQMLSGVKTDLVVLPELCTSGYVFETAEELLSVAEIAGEGESFRVMSSLASQNDCSIVFGFAELDLTAGAKLFNSSALLNPDGSWNIYRKAHLFYREKLFFSPGDTGFFVTEGKNGVKVGMLICFDWQFPEAMRTLALQGAQLVCHPSNLVLPWAQKAMTTRSLENRVFSLTANRIGKEGNGDNELSFTGGSQILSPRGEVLAALSSTEEGITTVEIAPQEADNKQVTDRNNAFTDRRPELYKL